MPAQHSFQAGIPLCFKPRGPVHILQQLPAAQVNRRHLGAARSVLYDESKRKALKSLPDRPVLPYQPVIFLKNHLNVTPCR
jgi:hypothetical protein